MATTYDLLRDSQRISIALIEAGTDEECDAAIEAASAWASSSEDKFLAHRYVRQDLIDRAARLKSEAQAILARVKAINANLEKIDDRLLLLLEAHAITTGEDRANLADGGWVQKRIYKSQQVYIDDPSELPKAFTIETVSADKRYIRDQLKLGREVPGAHLEDIETPGIQWSK
ncbi:hypothetical protein [uncultured Mediterranean phage]|nr:hypothetical protein [uncultured Mediterranean phage]